MVKIQIFRMKMKFTGQIDLPTKIKKKIMFSQGCLNFREGTARKFSGMTKNSETIAMQIRKQSAILVSTPWYKNHSLPWFSYMIDQIIC